MTYAENPDLLPCEKCERPVLLHDHPACPHTHVACEDCGHPAVCRQCEHNAELAANVAAGPPPHDIGETEELDLAAWHAELDAREKARKDARDHALGRKKTS